MINTIDIRSDIDKIARNLDLVERKQLPFAINLTLNKLAVKAQEAIIQRAQKVFYNKNRWYDRYQRTGIKVDFAAKSNLVASVYTKAHFAQIQEEGGIKRAYHGGNLAVPTGNVPKRLRNSGALRVSGGDRSIFKAGSSIFRRISNQKLQKLYSLTPQAKVRPRFCFKLTALKAFNSALDRVFTDSFNLALRG